MKTLVNKSEFKSYLQTETKMYEFNDLASAFVGIDENKFNQYNEASEMLQKHLDSQIDAACLSYGIDKVEFINQLNEYSENLNS